MKNTVIITGSLGLVGMESAKFFLQKKYKVIGIDNDMRNYFFKSSVYRNKRILEDYSKNYIHSRTDIRNKSKINELFKFNKNKICLIIHCAAQPSHDWAAKEPFTDFSINANGTLNLLNAFKQNCPKSVFIFMSTNKVYGDKSNTDLSFTEKKTRYELIRSHNYYKHGIPETFSIDQSKHSLFGVSKASADLMVQEFGRYFNLKTAVFRGGCLTGPLHQGAELHGFLSYLLKCNLSGKKYFVKGYKGKQVRDNIHSSDLVNAFWHFFLSPRYAEVYNIGGGRYSNCSIIEANKIIENISNKKTKLVFESKPRSGDHIWWISDIRKFQSHYKNWSIKHNINSIIEDMYRLS
jgi:CDP-paratose 2-epimerase